MEWPKLKNIILLMLLCVNAFLLVLEIQRQWESHTYAQGAREDAAAVLWETSRVHLDLDLLPQELSLPVLTVSRDPELERAQAAALLGEPLTLSQDGLGYEGPRGTAQFYVDGEVSAALTPGAWPLEGAAEDFALELLEAMGIEAEVLSVEELGAETVVTVGQLWAGTPVFDCTAVLVFRDGALREVRGEESRRLVGDPQPAGGTWEGLDLPTLLLRFAAYVQANGVVCREITGFTAGYALDAQSEPARLIPTWRVETDAGAFDWNTATGAVTPAG